MVPKEGVLYLSLSLFSRSLSLPPPEPAPLTPHLWRSITNQNRYSTVFAGKWDAGMATPRHTPKGRGYDSSLLYFHHCVDYWTLTPSIGCPAQTPMLPPPATGTQASGTPSPSGSTMEPIVDFWDGSGPSIENGTSECGREDQPLATCDCSSCSHCSNASDYYNGVGRALLGK